MRELTLFSLGKTKYGILQDEVPVVKDIGAIHWLPPVPAHIAGLTILDGSSLTLFDLPACIGLSPISKEKASYPVLLVEHGKSIAGFMVDFVMGHFSISHDTVHPMPDYLRTPIIDTCALYDSELIPLINTAELFNKALQADFEPSVSEFRTCGIKPEKISSIKTVRVFESGSESFAVCGACIEKAAVKPDRVTRLPLVPSYVGGVTFNNGNPITLIHLSSRMKLAEKGTWQQMLVADIDGQVFGLLVDSDRGQWDDANLVSKPVPPLAQSDWIRCAVLDGKEIIPIIELDGLMSDESDGSGEPPFPQRYTPDARFKSLFGRQEVKVLEFSLLGVRHAIPEIEVEDHFAVRPYRRLPNVLPIVAGVAQYKGELLPVLDPAACFGRASHITADWQMILVKNGDFRALVLTDTIFSERLLPLSRHRGIPFDQPHTLVYGCYPDEAAVRLVLNIEALAVYFDKVLYKEFFAILSKEMPIEPIEIEFDPDPTQTAMIGPAAESMEFPVIEKPEERVEPQEVVPIAAALASSEIEEENEVGKPAEISLTGEELSPSESEEIYEGQAQVLIQKGQEIIETKAKVPHSEFLKETLQEGPKPENITAIEKRKDILAPKEIAGTKPEMPQAGVSDEILQKPDPVETAAVEPVEETLDLLQSEEIEETVEPEKSTAVKVFWLPEDAEEGNGIVETKAVEPDESIAMAPALTSGGVVDDKEVRELDEIPQPVEEAPTAKPEEISTTEATAELQKGQRIIGSEPEVLQVEISEEAGREPEPIEADLSDQAEESVQFVESEEFTKPEEQEEHIEPEKNSVVTAFAPPVEIDSSRAEATDDYCEDDDREKPKKRLAMGLLAALLLIGFLTATLYTLDVFEGWIVREKSEKFEAPVATIKPAPTPAKPQKHLVPEKSSAVSPGPEITMAQKVKPRELVATKPVQTTQVKSSKRHVAKKSSSILHSSEPRLEPRKVKKERFEKSTAEVRYEFILIKSPEQATPDILSSDSHDLVIHRVKKGDTLWNISKYYTGSGFSYPGVAKENEIPNPDLIFPKQRIQIKRIEKYKKQSFKNLFKSTKPES